MLALAESSEVQDTADQTQMEVTEPPGQDATDQTPKKKKKKKKSKDTPFHYFFFSFFYYIIVMVASIHLYWSLGNSWK